MQRYIAKLTRELTKMKSHNDHDKSDHESIGSFESPLHKHQQRGHLLDRDEYREDFDSFVYGKINAHWYSPPTYDVFFYNDYVDDDIINNENNNNDNIIDDILLIRQRLSAKKTLKVFNKKVVHLNYVDHFD